MTEQVLQSSETTTQKEIAAERVDAYTALRDGVEDKTVRVEWRDGDRWARGARETYDKLQGDPDLSEEGKRARAQAAYDTAVTKAGKGYEAARKRAQELAKEHELRSIPMPDNRSLFRNQIRDSGELVATQTETMNIISRIERINASRPKNMSGAPHTLDILREAFGEGLEAGGIEGTVKCRAALRAAETLGIPRDDVVNPFMQDEHRESSDLARRYSVVAATIPSTSLIPEPPFKSDTSTTRGQFHTGTGTPKLFAKRSGGTQKVQGKGHLGERPSARDKTKRKPSWK
jgi:hypothetical protein